MNKKFRLVLVFISLSLFSCQDGDSDSLLIAAAANMQFAMEELLQAFSEQTGFDCELIISSSGKLTAQIREGAPYHLFVSADMKYPETLYESGFTLSRPKVYGYGKLVVWTVKEELPASLEAVKIARHIAIANPLTAPYGAAALEALTKSGWYESIQDKLVYGESIAQTNQFILSKSADIGLTAKSVVLSDKMKRVGKWLPIDEELYQPIAQGVVILKGNEDKRAQAISFQNFLFSKEAQTILQNFGYGTVN